MSENVSDEQHGRDSGKLTRRDLITSVGVAAAGASAANAWLFSTAAEAHTTKTTVTTVPYNDDPRIVLMERMINHHFTRKADGTIECPYKMAEGAVIWSDSRGHDDWVRNVLANFAPNNTDAIRDDIVVNGTVVHRGTGSVDIQSFAGQLTGLINHARNVNLDIFPRPVGGTNCEQHNNMYNVVQEKLRAQCDHCRGHGWAEAACHADKGGLITTQTAQAMLGQGSLYTPLTYNDLKDIYDDCKENLGGAITSHESY